MRKKRKSYWETHPFDLQQVAAILKSKVETLPVDLRWLAAIVRAEKIESLDPLITYMRHPATQPMHLGPGECWWLRRLFERMQFKRKKQGRFTPLGMRSAEQRNWLGAEHVRELKRIAKARGETLSTAAAITRVVEIYPPTWFKHDEGFGLASHIKRVGMASHIKRGTKEQKRRGRKIP